MNDNARFTTDQLRSMCRRPNYGFMRDMSDGPEDNSPEEMVEDLISEYGEDIQQSLEKELTKAHEEANQFYINYWQATLSYLARRKGPYLSEV